MLEQIGEDLSRQECPEFSVLSVLSVFFCVICVFLCFSVLTCVGADLSRVENTPNIAHLSDSPICRFRSR